MKRAHPQPAATIPVSRQVLQQLMTASCESAFAHEDWEIAAMAIHDWLARHSPESFVKTPANGYQWKKLFLPNGTLLRTVVKGKNHHCVVENDCILHNGSITSPSGFANAVGGMNRNAWQVVWLLFPDTDTWKLAADLRPKPAAQGAPSRRR